MITRQHIFIQNRLRVRPTLDPSRYHLPISPVHRKILALSTTPTSPRPMTMKSHRSRKRRPTEATQPEVDISPPSQRIRRDNKLMATQRSRSMQAQMVGRNSRRRLILHHLRRTFIPSHGWIPSTRKNLADIPRRSLMHHHLLGPLHPLLVRKVHSNAKRPCPRRFH